MLILGYARYADSKQGIRTNTKVAFAQNAVFKQKKIKQNSRKCLKNKLEEIGFRFKMAAIDWKRRERRMSIKPIIFNTEMVRAVLDGRKSVTRRLPPKHVRDRWFEYDEWVNAVIFSGCIRTSEKEFYEAYPPYQPGDILYVRETWAEVGGFSPSIGEFWQGYEYKATYKPDLNYDVPEIEWKSSIYMSRVAARIWLKVTDVWIERLLDITEEGAVAEGFENTYGVNDTIKTVFKAPRTAKESFLEFWDSTLKKKDLSLYGWEANPWVWVIKFERTGKPDERNN